MDTKEVLLNQDRDERTRLTNTIGQERVDELENNGLLSNPLGESGKHTTQQMGQNDGAKYDFADFIDKSDIGLEDSDGIEVLEPFQDICQNVNETTKITPVTGKDNIQHRPNLDIQNNTKVEDCRDIQDQFSTKSKIELPIQDSRNDVNRRVSREVSVQTEDDPVGYEKETERKEEERPAKNVSSMNIVNPGHANPNGLFNKNECNNHEGNQGEIDGEKTHKQQNRVREF